MNFSRILIYSAVLLAVQLILIAYTTGNLNQCVYGNRVAGRDIADGGYDEEHKGKADVGKEKGIIVTINWVFGMVK